MITLDEIRAGYPPQLHDRTSFLLREYLQYRMLQLIFRSVHGPKLVFLGGTCLRLLHGNQRFSEDLDFDNKGLTADQFKALADEVGRGLEREGYQVVLSVHDELLTETPDNSNYTVEGLNGILAQRPLWAPDIPLAAGGFEGRRYRKG